MMQPRTTVRFGLFELDPQARDLYRGGIRIRLAKQPFDLLTALIEQPGEVVSREVLQQRLWSSDTFVDYDHGLNKAVRKLREALGDSAESPRYIETVQRTGYRFIAPVQWQGKPAEDKKLPAEPTPEADTAGSGTGFDGSSAKFTRRKALLLGGGAAVLGGGGLWLGRSFRGTARERAVNLVLPLPLGTAAADPGHTLGSPVVSPDGTAVIVSLMTPEGTSLFIRRLDTDHLLRMEGTHGGGQPFWSPDSMHIGFFADSKLKRMPVAGGTAVILCDAAGSRGGAWGRGGVILFGLNFHGLYRVHENGGAAVPTTQLDAAAGENSHRNPVFFQDGVRFLYYARTDDLEKRAIYRDSLSPTSQRQRIAVADGEFALGRDPEGDAWFLLCQQSGKIVTQAFDERRGVLTGSSRVLLDRKGTISVSDTGTLAIRTEQQMLTRLLWLDREGRQTGLAGDTDDYWSVAISPDGRTLSTIRHNYLTGQFKVWTASCDRGLLEPLSDSDHAVEALWSSDSSTVYYTDIRRRKLVAHRVTARTPEEDVMDLSGDRSVLLDDLSSDGRVVIGELIASEAHVEINWTENKPHPEWHSVGTFGPQGVHAKLSRDGQWLASASFETGRSEIYLMKFPDAQRRQRISQNGGRTPRWRRDGKELFYVASDGGMMSVLRAGDAWGAPRKLFQTNLRVGSDRPVYDVTGDGQRFLIIDGESQSKESDVELVLHWPSLLTGNG